MSPSIIFKKISDIEFPTSKQNNSRIQNCFKNEKIIYVGDIFTKTLQEYYEVNQLGKKCIAAINKYLSDYYLTIGMRLTNWPPKNFDLPPMDTRKLDMTREELKQAWEITKDALAIAQEAHREALDAMEAATIEYHDAVNRWLKNVGAHTDDA